MKKLVAVFGMGIAAALTAPAWAQVHDYPARPVTLIMPYSAGTGIDTATRALAEKLRVGMKTPFIVQNKVGAGGNIGTEFVARSAPDGYTLLVVANTLAMNPSLYKNLPYDPVRDFAPVGLLFKGAMVLVAGSKVPARNLAEFVAAAAKAPGQYNYASAGVGTPQHLAIQSALAQIEAGKMHALAVSSPVRHPALPDVATVAESLGKPFDVDLWYGLFAPAGTSAAIVDKLHRQAQEALADRDMRQSLSAQGMAGAISTPAELGALVKSDLARWARVIEARGIAPN
ncbi:tripartite tricarboxylate transporter substrate-binding protein [Pigmentiphaga sp. GD03639]|uniref:tripartite tricarboxylate transporter substrate-binding protein n=1 Tax=Pigmentiphaga sp. GD03639 TaxID=2975354 RepID=UPI002446F1C3|nr:tripartite tricarboxylate transporter substrate-binding protein [Pigmentiphaga sp. GD03639]MDH2238537.1 tripartite tricarboxylate transporter substrate-binding protein [Pigmentiphaga sp. GD03639]